MELDKKQFEKTIHKCLKIRKVKKCADCLRYTWCKKLHGEENYK